MSTAEFISMADKSKGRRVTTKRGKQIPVPDKSTLIREMLKSIKVDK